MSSAHGVHHRQVNGEAPAEESFDGWDACAAGIAVPYFLLKGLGLLGIDCLYELRDSCHAGWEQTKKTFHHLPRAVGSSAEAVNAVVSPFLGEIGGLFLSAGRGLVQTVYALEGPFIATGEVVREAVRALEEGVFAGFSGVDQMSKFFWHTGHVIEVMGEVAADCLMPFVKEFGGVFSSGAQEARHAFQSARDVGSVAFQVLDAMVGGFVQETGSLIPVAFEQTQKTARSLVQGVVTWYTLSRDSTGRLFSEMGSTLQSGQEQAVKTFAHLPSAVYAAFERPIEGILAIGSEIIGTANAGRQEADKTFVSAGRVARSGGEVIGGVVGPVASEVANLGPVGVDMTCKTGVASWQALKNGSEGLRDGMASLASEGGAAVSSGWQCTQQTGHAGLHVLDVGAEIAAVPISAFGQELLSVLYVGGHQSQQCASGLAIALREGTAPPRELLVRIAEEILALPVEGFNQFIRSLYATGNVLRISFEIGAEITAPLLAESLSACLSGVDQTAKFGHQMTDGVVSNIRVHVFYPAERIIVPAVRAIQQAAQALGARVSLMAGRISVRVSRWLS